MSRKIWTKEDVSVLKEMYPFYTCQEILERLGRAKYSIYYKAHNLGLSKSDEFYKSEKSGRLRGAKGTGHRYQKGHVPANKGKKMTAEAKDKMKHTFFKKGHLPHNTLADGAITTRVDKRGIAYQFIRLSLGKWDHLHRHIYRTEIGEIPKGMMVAFKDGNPMNCIAANLELITKKENMIRNSIQNYPEEVQQGIRTISKLNKIIKKHEKQD